MLNILSKPLLAAIVTIALMFGLGIVLNLTMSKIAGMVESAATTAAAARDAHWQIEIEKANAVAAWNIIEQMRASRAADLAAQTIIDGLKNQISELEAKNEGMPDRDGSGIDRARTRLLNHEPLANDPH